MEPIFFFSFFFLHAQIISVKAQSMNPERRGIRILFFFFLPSSRCDILKRPCSRMYLQYLHTLPYPRFAVFKEDGSVVLIYLLAQVVPASKA